MYHIVRHGKHMGLLCVMSLYYKMSKIGQQQKLYRLLDLCQFPLLTLWDHEVKTAHVSHQVLEINYK